MVDFLREQLGETRESARQTVWSRDLNGYLVSGHEVEFTLVFGGGISFSFFHASFFATNLILY